MARSFIGKGWKHQAMERRKARWARMTPEQRERIQKQRLEAHARNIQNMNFLVKK